jgi:hypothetical protein
MKTLIFSTAIVLMMTLNLAAAPDGTKTSSTTKVEIFQTNPESVDVYVAKNAGELVRINIYSESGTRLMTTRMKKQNVRYIRFHLNELPEGSYKICVEKDDETISSLDVSK